MDKYFLFFQVTNFCTKHLPSTLSAKAIEIFLSGSSSIGSIYEDSPNEHFSVLKPCQIEDTLGIGGILHDLTWKSNSEGFIFLRNLLLKCCCKAQDCSVNEKSNDLVADAIHFLADSLPPPGTFCLEVIWLTHSPFVLPADAVQLFGALARLATFHDARIYILNLNDMKNVSEYTPWKDVLPSVQILFSNLPLSLDPQVLWTGDVKLTGHQGEQDLTILNAVISGRRDQFFFHNRRNETHFHQLGRKLEIVCATKLDTVPLHALMLDSFHLSFSDGKRSDLFVRLCSKLTREGIGFLGYMWHSLLAKDDEYQQFTTEEWISFIENTRTINKDLLKKKEELEDKKMFILHTSSNDPQRIIITFLHDMEAFNSQGSKQLCHYVRNMVEKNDPCLRPVLQPSSNWLEKMAWLNEEFMKSAKGSLVRFQSSDMTLAGIPVPSKDEASDQRTLEEITEAFKSDGNPVNLGLKTIPLASDRLLKNICSAATVRGLPFEEAKSFTAHGIEYCLDSQFSLRLDSRLMRIRARYIVDDTRCSWDISAKEEINRRKKISFKKDSLSSASKRTALTTMSNKSSKAHQGIKRKLSSTDVPFAAVSLHDDHASNSKQPSRSERHKKRLRLIAEAVVQKYGKVDRENKNFSNCVDRLYSLCESFLKDLTTSKGLGEEMKRLAKLNVTQVVEFELKRHGSEKS